jgi:DNA topoisomerase VI subunit B
MKLRLGNAAILAYRRLPYRLWYAIAEFVDNSTDAYMRGDNKSLLDAHYKSIGDVLSIDVSYDKDKKTLEIFDNSMGMNEEELEAALIIGDKPIVTAGRSEFGMGMKTAAIWFADFIEIRTKKLGHDREYRVKIDIQKYVSGDDVLEYQSTPKQKDISYTHISLSGLQRVIRGNALERTREFLGSIYREDIRNNLIKLTVIGKEVSAPTSKDDDAL